MYTLISIKNKKYLKYMINIPYFRYYIFIVERSLVHFIFKNNLIDSFVLINLLNIL